MMIGEFEFADLFLGLEGIDNVNDPTNLEARGHRVKQSKHTITSHLTVAATLLTKSSP